MSNAPSILQGQWAITAGLNNLFDVFDCQVHQFSIEDSGLLHGDIDWRIKLDDGDYIERKAVQTFKQVCLRIAISQQIDSLPPHIFCCLSLLYTCHSFLGKRG